MSVNSDIKNDVMLSTFDNPYSPFDEFEIWWKTDKIFGHDTCELLAKESFTSDVASDEVNDRSIEEGMNKICQMFPMIYRKVTREDYSHDRNHS